MDLVVALQRIAYLLERQGAPLYRSRAFRRAAEAIRSVGEEAVRHHVAAGTLEEIRAIGVVTKVVIEEALRGSFPEYLAKLEQEGAATPPSSGTALRARLRGDCHAHTNWSDGKSSVEEMAEAARALGHEYLVITDPSPRLVIARGLSAERLAQQLELIERHNEKLAPFHSKLRMEGKAMTERMLNAISNPHLDVLGHCTGRIVVGKGRPESSFDAERALAACAERNKAIEINARRERLDPPRRLLRIARELGCLFCVNTDAHNLGQLDWQINGCERATACEVEATSVVNSWESGALLEWSSSHASTMNAGNATREEC